MEAPILTLDPHEAAVEAFMAEAQLRDPEKYAVICARHPVKSRRQMRRISEIELPMGLAPFEADPYDPYLNRYVANATGELHE
jgi:hypothetical protein